MFKYSKPNQDKPLCVVIQHLSFEGLGVLEPVLLEHNYNIIYKNVGMDEITQNDILDSNLLILLGSPISVNQTKDYPWLVSLISWLGKRLLKKLAMLGICFGAQLIALVMGSRVFQNKRKEIGWSSVCLTKKGIDSSLIELKNKKVLHWHNETFELPFGAELLASTEITENQAFSFQKHVLALQFHCEVSGTNIEPWLIGHHHELSSQKINILELRKTSHIVSYETCLASKKMFSKWIDTIETSSP